MPDFLHMDNIIQGEVLRITERRPPEAQIGALEALYQFLGDQQHKVLMAKLRVAEQYPPPANESAPDDRSGDGVLSTGVPSPGEVDGSPEREAADNGLSRERSPDD